MIPFFFMSGNGRWFWSVLFLALVKFFFFFRLLWCPLDVVMIMVLYELRFLYFPYKLLSFFFSFFFFLDSGSHQVF